MVSEAEQTWKTYRHYRYKGIKIFEDDKSIRFEQRNVLSKPRLYLLVLVSMFIWFLPIPEMAGKPNADIRSWIPIACWFVYPPLAVLFGRFFIFLKTIVSVEQGTIRVRRKNRDTNIPIAEIRNVDVRYEEEQHAVAIWHGPVPVISVSAKNPTDAITLKEALVAAIGIMNQQSNTVAARKVQAFAE